MPDQANSVNKDAIIKSLFVLIIVAILATLFEFTKQLVIKDITIWQSHIITIIVLSLSGFITSFYYYQHKFLKGYIKNELKKIRKESVEPNFDKNIEEEINQIYAIKPLLWFQRKYIANKNKKATEIIHKIQKELALQKLSEQKLQQYTNQLSELDAAKNKFFSIISHDLKNPFNVLLGMSRLLVDYAEEYDKEKIVSQAKRIYETSNKAFLLLEDLLAWSSSQIGRLVVMPEKLNLFYVINSKIVEIETIAKYKGITIQIECEKDIYCFADVNMVSTVLRNLLYNAIKFSNFGSRIVVRTEQESHFIKISVCDSGVGMDKDDINNLFRIDVNISRIGTNGENGTGLGLILCKEFVEKNNGIIWVESELGKGSKFIFTIPKYVKIEAEEECII